MSLEDAITFHECEERRLSQAMNRWWAFVTGQDLAYGEAVAAHQAALVHLRKFAIEPEPEKPPAMEAGATHNFERGPGAQDYEGDVDARVTFGFVASTAESRQRKATL